MQIIFALPVCQKMMYLYQVQFLVSLVSAYYPMPPISHGEVFLFRILFKNSSSILINGGLFIKMCQGPFSLTVLYLLKMNFFMFVFMIIWNID